MTDYFSLFSLPRSFFVDADKLKTIYQTLQKLTHPDRFANESEQQKRLYMQKNAQINDAYFVLKSPIKRGEHLLQLVGYELADEQATMGDTEFLMQQMELREALLEADTVSELEMFIADTQKQCKDFEQQIGAALEANSQEQNENAASLLTKLKFLTKLMSEAEHKLEQLNE